MLNFDLNVPLQFFCDEECRIGRLSKHSCVSEAPLLHYPQSGMTSDLDENPAEDTGLLVLRSDVRLFFIQDDWSLLLKRNNYIIPVFSRIK